MRSLICIILCLTLVGCAAPVSAEKPTLETDDQKTLYALGLALSQRLSAAGLSEADVELVTAGLADGLLEREAQVELTEYGPKIDSMLQGRIAAAAEVEKQESLAYCEAKAAEEGAVTTESGAIYFETEAGTGASPTATDRVRLHYHGTLRDGRVFDSSVDKGEPAVFALNQVVPCFGEGVQQMKVGGKATLVCPPDTAYGDRGSPPMVRPGAALTFEVELLGIEDGAETR